MMSTPIVPSIQHLIASPKSPTETSDDYDIWFTPADSLSFENDFNSPPEKLSYTPKSLPCSGHRKATGGEPGIWEKTSKEGRFFMFNFEQLQRLNAAFESHNDRFCLGLVKETFCWVDHKTFLTDSSHKPRFRLALTQGDILTLKHILREGMKSQSFELRPRQSVPQLELYDSFSCNSARSRLREPEQKQTVHRRYSLRERFFSTFRFSCSSILAAAEVRDRTRILQVEVDRFGVPLLAINAYSCGNPKIIVKTSTPWNWKEINWSIAGDYCDAYKSS